MLHKVRMIAVSLTRREGQTKPRDVAKGLTLWSLTIGGNHFSRARYLFFALISGSWTHAKSLVSRGRQGTCATAAKRRPDRKRFAFRSAAQISSTRVWHSAREQSGTGNGVGRPLDEGRSVEYNPAVSRRSLGPSCRFTAWLIRPGHSIAVSQLRFAVRRTLS